MGDKFMVTQGNGQGRIPSPDDFKEYVDEHIDTMEKVNSGTEIGTTFTGMLACANDVLLSIWSVEDMLVQMGMAINLNNRDRLQVNPLKTSISVFGMSQSELDHLKSEQPWTINGEPVPVGTDFTHL